MFQTVDIHYMNDISTNLTPHKMIISTFILLSIDLEAGAHKQNWPSNPTMD